ncbi:MAG: aromatic ring-hydroxylating oxygenase subunit alpha [Ornithinimicrobium sp.]|uniref:aromatic ring-hydroxylating oxygenase subunit alpha n=1 Tax=Ornithinimicrobium sp. TaxID=1977084 RepID=UPI003D9B164D
MTVTETTTWMPGYSLPQRDYVDQDIFDLDMERVFARSWLLLGSTAELPQPGAVLTWSVGRDSVVVTRDQDGSLQAHHNVCRHRGSRLRPDGCGSERVLVCPYHQWTYGLDGSLRGAPHMGSDLSRDQLGLRPVHLRELAGLLFVCFDQEAPAFDHARAAIGPQLGPHRLDRTKVAARLHYDVRANWKMLVENNRECYHCRANHPEFCQSNYDLGGSGDSRTNSRYEATLASRRASWTAQGLSPFDVSFDAGGSFRVARLPLRDGYLTESLSGRLVAPVLGALDGADVGSLRVISLPNSWSHANADYAMTTRLTPISPALTAVDVTFLVRDDAVEGADYDLAELTEVWVATSEQDWVLCEQNHAGAASRGYLPGPLSTVTEGSVGAFHSWYARALAEGSA